MLKRNAFNRTTGFTLIELLVVLTVIGVLAMIVAPFYRGSTTDARAKQITSFVQGAADNFRLIAAKCGTSTDTSTSSIVSTPSAINTMALIISGSGYLNATYANCYAQSSVVPLHNKATGNATDGFRIAGYPIAWSGGGVGTPIAFSVTGMSVDEALLIYNERSSAVGAHTATALPGAGDATDPAFRFTAPANGVTNVTFFIY